MGSLHDIANGNGVPFSDNVLLGRPQVGQRVNESTHQSGDVVQSFCRTERAAMPFHFACEEIRSAVSVVFVEDCLGVGAYEFFVGFDAGVVMMTIPPSV